MLPIFIFKVLILDIPHTVIEKELIIRCQAFMEQLVEKKSDIVKREIIAKTVVSNFGIEKYNLDSCIKIKKKKVSNLSSPVSFI